VNKRPLAVIALFFILGIVLARYLPESVKFVHVLVGTSIFILFAFLFTTPGPGSIRPGSGGGKVLLILSVISFAVLLYLNANTFPENHITNFIGEEKIKTGIVGTIKSPALTRRPYYGKIASTYLFDTEAIKRDGEWWKVKGVAQIRIQTEKDLAYGNRLVVKGTIMRPRNDSYYRSYLERQNIFALINTKEYDVTILSHNYKSNSILKYIYAIRERIKDRIIGTIPLETGAFLRAILLGDRSELPRHIQDSFKKSGTMHILAISGLHIAIIVLVILYLFRIIGVKREIYYTLTIIFLIFFALFTLSRPSVVRASIMACAFLVGILLGRKVDVYNSLGFAALFILIKNPKDLFNVGFQLSFLAVVSILFFVPRLMKLLEDYKNYYVKKFLYIPLAVSVSAWVATFPLVLYYFKIITPVAIIANLFIIPMLFAMLIASMAFLALGWLPVLGPFLSQVNHLIAQAIFSLADFFSSLKFGHFYI